ncbi:MULTISPECIES: DeoR/GlpR family DNA-binding transcription regulator [unclassified Streptomyces]|uniref:DeoR/GlpR family DNA-binding transcription regulator n=1 Tax=unclassified Streptomyces TaxID=2593676 RepID=UPI00225422D5|nr:MULTISPECIES: DeoR/GlpR family DNA-binding transcription regulator [unclassified Streptomyces]MCX4529538.1 DeoR/GlpR family DNA-binding transcription regulator [Streptomyces sp. NBC_01551]MCX4539889.1 DeoR/GlpR family DNA-binding transcription regulator [Streptomyces sp. NBC_01565]
MTESARLAPQRRALILDIVRRDGAVRVADLVEQLGVSDMTIRRDLDVLARTGSLSKVHGGAISASVTTGEEPPFETKAGLESRAKSAVAEAASALVKPGSVVAISGGTTSYAVAARLRDVAGLTVVTNSLPVAQLLRPTGAELGPAGPTLLLTGGTPTKSASLVGPLADQAIRSLQVDLLIIGAHGVSERAGATTPNLAEAETNRALIDCATQVAVVADHTKWGVVGLSRFIALSEIDYFVSDDGLDPEACSVLRDSVGQLLLGATRP